MRIYTYQRYNNTQSRQVLNTDWEAHMFPDMPGVAGAQSLTNRVIIQARAHVLRYPGLYSTIC